MCSGAEKLEITTKTNYMKRIRLHYLILLTLAVSLVAGSCSRQIDLPEPPPGGDQTEVVFALRVPAQAAATKALGEEDENEIKEIDVLVFDAGGNYLYTAFGYNFQQPNPVDPTRKTFNVKLRTGTFDLMILANARKIISDAYPTGIANGTTRAALETALTMTKTGGWNADPSDGNYKAIPMWGYIKNTTVSASSAQQNAYLSRMVAKVDIGVNPDIDPDDFKLTSVYFYNGNTVGRLIPDGYDDAGSTWQTATPAATDPSLPGAPARELGPLPYTALQTVSGSAQQELKGMIYAFEAEKGTFPETDWAKFLENPCLVVGGEYMGGQESFYRIDFVKKVGTNYEYLHLLRNYLYNVTIQSVSGPGFPQVDDAFNSHPVNIDAEVIPWNDSEITEVVIDGPYMFGVNEGEFTLSRDAHTNSPSETDNKLIITTNYRDGWVLDKIVDDAGVTADWLTLSQNSGGAARATVSLVMSENQTAGVRTAFVHLKAGRMSYVVTVHQLRMTFNFLGRTPVATWIDANNPTTVEFTAYTDDAWDIFSSLGQTASEVASPIDDKKLSFDIPAMTDAWGSRTITVWAENNGQRYGEGSYIQKGYGITNISPIPTDVPGSGGNVTFDFTGYFPAMNVCAVLDDNTVVSNVVTLAAAGSATADGTESVTIRVKGNYVGPERNVTYQYEKTPGVWEKFAGPLVQPQGNFALSTGRIIAVADVTSDLSMTWATAMGIDASYDNTLFPGPDRDYTTTRETGCAAYYEGDPSDPVTGKGKWQLMTADEMRELGDAGPDVWRYVVKMKIGSTYRTSTQYNAYNVMVCLGGASLDAGPKTPYGYVHRCVREQ